MSKTTHGLGEPALKVSLIVVSTYNFSAVPMVVEEYLPSDVFSLYDSNLIPVFSFKITKLTLALIYVLQYVRVLYSLM